jgi:hypothetical protein
MARSECGCGRVGDCRRLVSESCVMLRNDESLRHFRVKLTIVMSAACTIRCVFDLLYRVAPVELYDGTRKRWYALPMVEIPLALGTCLKHVGLVTVPRS